MKKEYNNTIEQEQTVLDDLRDDLIFYEADLYEEMMDLEW